MCRSLMASTSTLPFSLCAEILNQVVKFLIETETHQWDVVFFICIIYV